jgi:hypothetical protein
MRRIIFFWSLPFLIKIEVAMTGSLPGCCKQGQRFETLDESVVHNRDGMKEDVRDAFAVRESQNEFFHRIDAGLRFCNDTTSSIDP